MAAVTEWVVKLQTKSGWGEVETIEVGRLGRRGVGLTAEEAGLTLAERKNLLGELASLLLQTVVDVSLCSEASSDIRWRKRRAATDHIGCLLCDHQGGGIGIGGWAHRHD